MLDIVENKKLHLVFEVETAMKLIRLGLGELQKIDGENDFYFFPFMLLSNGFERLLKCIYCYYFWEHRNRFPAFKEIKTHDIKYFVDWVLSECFEKDLKDKCKAIQQDYDFIKNNILLDKMLHILSEFNIISRYYNLNIVIGKTKRSLDVNGMWEDIETQIVKDDDELKVLLSNHKELDKIYCKIVTKMVSTLERFTSGLTRQFTLGNLGEEAKVCLPYLDPFLYWLSEDDFGKINHRNY